MTIRMTDESTPGVVCNGYPDGKAAEVSSFNTKAVSWLKENVNSGRWVGKAVQVPIHEVANMVAKASAAGLEVKTNNV